MNHLTQSKQSHTESMSAISDTLFKEPHCTLFISLLFFEVLAEGTEGDEEWGMGNDQSLVLIKLSCNKIELFAECNIVVSNS